MMIYSKKCKIFFLIDQNFLSLVFHPLLSLETALV